MNGLRYVRIGNGAPRFLVMSGGDAFMRPYDAARAKRVARVFPADARIDVVSYAPPATTVDALVDDAGSILREMGPAIVAGISFGGLLATRIAARHSTLVRGLVLVSSGRRFSDEGRHRVRQQIADIRRGDPIAMARPFLTIFRSPWRNLLMRVAFTLGRRRFARSLNAPDFIAAMLQIALDAESDVTVHVPALTVIGESDQFFDTTAAVGEQKIFRGETHTVALERPRDVQRAIAEFALQRARRE